MNKKVIAIALMLVLCLTAVGVALAATNTTKGKALSASVAKNTITIWRKDTGNETLKVASNAKITFDGKEVTLNKIAMPANVVLEKEKLSNGKFVVKSIKATKIKTVEIAATVNALSEKEMSLVLLMKDNSTKIMNADSKTVIKRDGKVIQFKEIKEKDVINAECLEEYDGELYCKTAVCKEGTSTGGGAGGSEGGGCGCGCGGGCGSGGGCCP